MVSLDLDGSTYRPELAESWDVSDDGLTWTFHLRPGATWHDGEPVTASDVAFTYDFYGSHEDFPYMPGTPPTSTASKPSTIRRSPFT